MITLKITVVVTLCFSQVKAMGALSPNDPSSYSRPEFAVMKHVSLDLNVDFEKKILNGTALLNFDVLEKVGELILDVNGLTINSVETEDGKPMAYKIDGDIPNFGSRLTITLPDVPEKPSDGKKVTPRESINDPGTTVESKSDAAEPSSQSKNDDEPSSKSIEDAGPSSKPIEDAGTSSKPIENAGQSSKPIENAEPSSKPIENAEPSSKQIENAEPSSKPIENAEPSSKPIENAEPSSKPIENAGPPSKSIENAGPPSKSIENAGPPSKSIKDAGPNTESQNVVSSTPLEAAKSCPGCGPVPATLSVSYNGYFYKPLLDKTTSMKKEKEATSNEKDKKNGIEDSEPCSCPTSTIVTIENIHNPCDSGKCTCGVSTNSYPKITCQGCSDSDCTFLEMQEKPEEWELEYEDKVSRVSAGVQTDYYKIISTSKATSMVDKSTSFVLATGVSETAKTHTGAASPIHGTNDVLKIRINYATSPTASALQWLDPQQTTGKKHPYLFSQCQPIHARSILPCQDTPAVKFTYDAQVTAPEQFTVLMSALRGGVNGTKTTFRQPMPIPSYLLAIAVGVLEHKQLGPRSAVWTEKEDLERSAWEFAETEKFLQAAERLCGPYEWSQYDLLVLPPSFPYGGMENPCLTFVTPTLLAGDRSQADVIVHEIMHSWTGNLVTNKNFEHFWLNEGFTVFLERKVGASLIADKDDARKSRDFHSLLGLQELNEAVSDKGATNALTKLVVDLKGVHPDDAFSTVPYEKGSLFLVFLERLLGGPEVFDDFLRAYLNRFKKKSLDTDEFKAFLLNYFKGDEKLKTVDWDSWLYKPGMPPVIPNYETSMTKDVTSLLDKINSDAPLDPADVRSFTPHQVINLLQELIDRPPLSRDRLASLGREYDVANSNNSEIKYRWLRLCIRSRDEEKVPEALDFVNQQGRMKYIRPLYRDLYAWQQVRDAAIANFLKNEKNMMHVSAYTVRKELHLNVINE